MGRNSWNRDFPAPGRPTATDEPLVSIVLTSFGVLNFWAQASNPGHAGGGRLAAPRRRANCLALNRHQKTPASGRKTLAIESMVDSSKAVGSLHRCAQKRTVGALRTAANGAQGPGRRTSSYSSESISWLPSSQPPRSQRFQAMSTERSRLDHQHQQPRRPYRHQRSTARSQLHHRPCRPSARPEAQTLRNRTFGRLPRCSTRMGLPRGRRRRFGTATRRRPRAAAARTNWRARVGRGDARRLSDERTDEAAFLDERSQHPDAHSHAARSCCPRW